MKHIIAIAGKLVLLCCISIVSKSSYAVPPGPSTVFVHDFHAIKRVDGAVVLHWIPGPGMENASAFVEHSTNGEDFTTLGQADRTMMEENNVCSFLHKATARGRNYYRIRLVAEGGREALSEPCALMISHKMQDIRVIPDPIMGKATVIIPASHNENVQLSIRDISGKLLETRSGKTRSERLVIDLSEMDRGLYSFEIARQYGEILRGKLMVGF